MNSRAVIFFSNPDKLDATLCQGIHNWTDDEDFKYLEFESGGFVLLVSDQLSKDDLANVLNEQVSSCSQYAYVYHSEGEGHMKVSKQDLDGCFPNPSNIVGNCFGMHDKDLDDWKELKTEIYNKYLRDIFDSVNKDDETDKAFKALWAVFQEESELEISLNLLYDIYMGKPKDAFESEENKKIRERAEVVKSYSDLIDDTAEWRYDSSRRDGFIDFRDKLLQKKVD